MVSGCLRFPLIRVGSWNITWLKLPSEDAVMSLEDALRLAEHDEAAQDG